MAVEMPRKECMFAFALQADEGTAMEQGDQVVLPLPGGEEIYHNKDYTFPLYADGQAYETLELEGGEYIEGDVRLPLIPGSASDLCDWIITRDSDWQGKWATVWIDLGGRVKKKFSDVKVANARIVARQKEVLELVCTLRGKVDETGEAITGATPKVVEYVGKENTFQLDWDSDTYATVTTLRELSINVDNKVQSVEEGMRLAATAFPTSLSNSMGHVVEGQLERDFTSATGYDAWVAGSVGALKLITARTIGGTTYTLTLTLPRIKWVQHLSHIPDGDGFVPEGIPFRAMGALTGATGPITFEESESS